MRTQKPNKQDARAPCPRLVDFPTKDGCVRYDSVEKARVKEESPESVPEHELIGMTKLTADTIRLWAQSRVEAAALDERPDPRVFGAVRWPSEKHAAEVALYSWVTFNGRELGPDVLDNMRKFGDVVPFVYDDDKLGCFWVQQIGKYWTAIAPRVRRSITEGIQRAKKH